MFKIPGCCVMDYILDNTKILFIHSHGLLGWFRLLAIMNNATMNLSVHVFVLTNVFYSLQPRSGIARSYGNSMSNFLRKSQTFLISSCLVLGLVGIKVKFQGSLINLLFSTSVGVGFTCLPSAVFI